MKKKPKKEIGEKMVDYIPGAKHLGESSPSEHDNTNNNANAYHPFRRDYRLAVAQMIQIWFAFCDWIYFHLNIVHAAVVSYKDQQQLFTMWWQQVNKWVASTIDILSYRLPSRLIID